MRALKGRPCLINIGDTILAHSFRRSHFGAQTQTPIFCLVGSNEQKKFTRIRFHKLFCALQQTVCTQCPTSMPLKSFSKVGRRAQTVRRRVQNNLLNRPLSTKNTTHVRQLKVCADVVSDVLASCKIPFFKRLLVLPESFS